MTPRSPFRWMALRCMPVLLALGAVVVLAGCASGGGRGDDCGCANLCVPSGCGSLPTDLPRDPDPCLKYCKKWVPPVYRQVPSLEMTPSCMQSVDRKVMKTCFVEREVKPRECTSITHESCSCENPCEQTAVEVCPGGWKWQDVGCDCWKYCYTPPTYKWCTKTVKEDKICYCVETPPEYETVAITCPTTTCDMKYVPPQYKVVWNRECYSPGHYVWVPENDACGSCQREPCHNPRSYVVPTPKIALTKTCPRCNEEPVGGQAAEPAWPPPAPRCTKRGARAWPQRPTSGARSARGNGGRTSAHRWHPDPGAVIFLARRPRRGRQEPSAMTHVVTGRCVDCRYTYCVVECPVSCFWEITQPRMLVIDPGTCIDCEACVPACPINAIWPDHELPPEYAEWTAQNADTFAKGTNITEGTDPLDSAKLIEEIQAEEKAKGWNIKEPSKAS